MIEYQEVIFDSNICDWSINSSTFDERLLDKENIIIMIEIEDNIKFGIYIHERINQINQHIKDSKSFIFSFSAALKASAPLALLLFISTVILLKSYLSSLLVL